MMKVKIAAGYTGHRHRGQLVEPGDEIEVTERQERWLRSIGALETKSRRRKAEKPADEDIPTED